MQYLHTNTTGCSIPQTDLPFYIMKRHFIYRVGDKCISWGKEKAFHLPSRDKMHLIGQRKGISFTESSQVHLIV
ncbi:hypothetical protein J7E81_30165, partial [Bacillus sp. ISL-18]|uniref:hypothetical protein n=1 Tax=Bacillus sp. ISL-18 TaxID=2819118 RepID=UPI001BECD329